MSLLENKLHYNYVKNSELPDVQADNKISDKCANVPIQEVGIENLHIPLKYCEDNDTYMLETQVSMACYLEKDIRAINMGRLTRIIHSMKDEIMNFDTIGLLLKRICSEVVTNSAKVELSFRYPSKQYSLRSDMMGIQYYDVKWVGKCLDGKISYTIYFDIQYSSACPCSYALSNHAEKVYGVSAIPHSQRSIAHIKMDVSQYISIGELISICRQGLKTETQVIVKRNDEQAFAELNGAHQKFVEDAARILYNSLSKHSAIKKFFIKCIHNESLHSFNAVSYIHN